MVRRARAADGAAASCAPPAHNHCRADTRAVLVGRQLCEAAVDVGMVPLTEDAEWLRQDADALDSHLSVMHDLLELVVTEWPC